MVYDLAPGLRHALAGSLVQVADLPDQRRAQDGYGDFSVALGRALVELLVADPETVLARGRRNLATMRAADHARRAEPWLAAWERLLHGPLEDLTAALVADDEEGLALRQNSPFAGVLSPQERWTILRELKVRRRDASQPA